MGEDMIEKHFKKAYKEWCGKDGYLHCPKCNTTEVAHIAIAHEGDLLICLNPSCKNETKIGEEEQKIKKGFKL